MAKRNDIKDLKTLAKQYARANRIALNEALDALAVELGFSHWGKLAGKAKQGWLPKAEQVSQAEMFARQNLSCSDEKELFIEQSLARSVDGPVRQGKIGDNTYRVFDVLSDIRLEGDGWRILVGEAQFSQPIVEIEAPHAETSPLNDRDLLETALAIVDEEAVKVRAGISSNWPRRSTKPDADGVVLHPIFGDKAADWYCLHCDGKISGTQLAQNLWHCPGCGAAPLDIYSRPFWLGEDCNVVCKPVESSKLGKRPSPKIEVVDTRPTLTIGEDNVSLFLRIALLEDAETPAERIAALQSEIYVDEEGDASIVLDEDLWFDSKEPKTAIAVARQLGIELDLSASCISSPFAWFDLGNVTTSTHEYIRLLLDAYEEHGVIRRERKAE